jgi:hypothetical protein
VVLSAITSPEQQPFTLELLRYKKPLKANGEISARTLASPSTINLQLAQEKIEMSATNLNTAEAANTTPSLVRFL